MMLNLVHLMWVPYLTFLPSSSQTDLREDGNQQDFPSGIFPHHKAQTSSEIHSTEFQCRCFELRVKFYILYKINILR